MDLKNNTVLITGGSSGIGLELAGRLIENKNKVIICGRSLEKLERARIAIPNLHAIQCDLSDRDDCKKLINTIKTEYPEINVLINNAAIVHTDELLGGNQMIEKAEKEFQTNTLAPIQLIDGLLDTLMSNPKPSIVNVTTGLAYVPKAAYPYYNATKAALHSYTQVLRYQVRSEKIKIVEAMFPAVDTPWHKGEVPKIAIPVNRAVSELISGLENDMDEIRIGKVKLIYWISRISPGLAFKKINSLK